MGYTHFDMSCCRSSLSVCYRCDRRFVAIFERGGWNSRYTRSFISCLGFCQTQRLIASSRRGLGKWFIRFYNKVLAQQLSFFCWSPYPFGNDRWMAMRSAPANAHPSVEPWWGFHTISNLDKLPNDDIVNTSISPCVKRKQNLSIDIGRQRPWGHLFWDGACVAALGYIYWLTEPNKKAMIIDLTPRGCIRAIQLCKSEEDSRRKAT